MLPIHSGTPPSPNLPSVVEKYIEPKHSENACATMAAAGAITPVDATTWQGFNSG